MKINFKALSAVLAVFGLISGTGADAGTNGTITVTTDNIRGGSYNSVDPIIPADPSDLYERGVVRSLYAIPAYDEKYLKREQINVMKYGIPNNPNRKIKRPKEIIVEKYDIPELEKEPVINRGEPVAKYALPEFMNDDNPSPKIKDNEPILLKYAMPNFPDEKPVKPENNEINTNNPDGEHFVPLLKYAVPYFPDKKEQKNEE